jgi:hypothetical protein
MLHTVLEAHYTQQSASLEMSMIAVFEQGLISVLGSPFAGAKRRRRLLLLSARSGVRQPP